MLTRSFLFRAALTLALVSFAPVLPADELSPAAELDAALAKLHRATFRKREQMAGRIAAAAPQAPIVTEVSGNRQRVIVEMQLPQFGLLRQEQIKDGNRTAVRLIAPGLQAKLAEAKRNVTASSAKALLQQILSLAAATQTGGLSSLQLLREATSAGLNIKSTAQARAALDQAEKAFGVWQLAPVDPEDADEPPTAEENHDSSEAFGGAPNLFTVTKETVRQGKFYRYTRKMSMAGMDTGGFSSVVLVDAQTGYPVSEETIVRGERLMSAEYFDVGADISIELPDCLK